MNDVVFLAYAPCGCIIAAATPECGEDLADWVRKGYRIEGRTTPVNIGGDCKHTPKWGKTLDPAGLAEAVHEEERHG